MGRVDDAGLIASVTSNGWPIGCEIYASNEGPMAIVAGIPPVRSGCFAQPQDLWMGHLGPGLPGGQPPAPRLDIILTW